MESDWLFLERPLHPNHFPKFQIPEEQRGNFYFSLEGAIQAVKPSLINPVLANPEIFNIRIGYTKAPARMKVENMEDLLKVIAILLEE